MIPIEVELAALHVIQQRKATQKEENEMRILKLEQLQFHRDEAIEYNARQAEKRRQIFNKKLSIKGIKEGSLVLRYDNRFDTVKGKKFVPRWEGPFQVVEKFANGSYQLMDINGRIHRTRVNGWRIKPYLPYIFNTLVEQET